MSVREIARKLGLSRNTVRRHLRDPEAARYRLRPSRPGKLDGFEAYVARSVASAAPDRLALTALQRPPWSSAAGRGRSRPGCDARHRNGTLRLVLSPTQARFAALTLDRRPTQYAGCGH